MTDYVQWGEFSQGDGSSNGGKSNYLKLESGKTYKVRPILKPVLFYKYFHKKDGKNRTAVCSKPDIEIMQSRHSELKEPSERYAAYVIDREDGRVKIMEAGKTVFHPIGISFEATGKDPGSGKEGSDWQISVTGKGLTTKYSVAFAGYTPITSDEKEAIKEAMGGDKEKLKKLYKAGSIDEIEQKLFGDNSSVDASSSNSSAPELPTSGSSSDAVAANDDNDFDNNW
jgi:hypothetical protein